MYVYFTPSFHWWMRLLLEAIHIGAILYLVSILMETSRRAVDLETRISALESKNTQGTPS